VTTTKTEVSSKLWKLGESITVTELEVCAVRAWATVALAQANDAGEEAKFMGGFMMGALRDTDENLALFIAMGKMAMQEAGERPLSAEFMETH
jgi:hypothetical protein